MGEMKVGHTPGPWIADVRMTGCFAVVAGPHRGFTICSRNGNAERASELVADAHLIAAAPDLLESARGIVSGVHSEYRIPADADDDYIHDTIGTALSDAYFSARAAIAKAEDH